MGVSLLAPGPVKTRMVDAERNRPADVPAGRRATGGSGHGAACRNHRRIGMEPAEVAGQVLDAIRTNTFFVLPHPEMAQAGVQRRLDWMATGTPPPARQAGS